MKKQMVTLIAGYLVMAGAGHGTAFLPQGTMGAVAEIAAAHAPTNLEGPLLGESFIHAVRHAIDDVDGTNLAALYVNAAEDERMPLLAMVSASSGSFAAECVGEGCLDIPSLSNEYTSAVALASSASAQTTDGAGESRARWPQEFGNSSGTTSGGRQVLGNGNTGAQDKPEDNVGPGAAPDNGVSAPPGGNPPKGAPDIITQPGKPPSLPVNGPGKGPDDGPVNGPDKGPDKDPVNGPGDGPVIDPGNGTDPDVHPVPEPGSLALLAMGLAGLAVTRCRRKGRS